MSAAETLLAELQAQGVTLIAQGECLLYKPREAIAGEQLEKLRACKKELLQILNSPRLSFALNGVQEEEVAAGVAVDIRNMSLREFARAALVVVVWSEVLGERVVLASDNAIIDPGERRGVVYRAEELQELLACPAEELRTIHTVKRIFRGRILAS